MIKLIPLAKARRIVIKIGTGVLTSGIGNLDTIRIHTLCEQIAALHKLGIEVVLVSSGAIGLGMGKLKLSERPSDLAQLQACAAVGQSILINTWQAAFDPHNLTVAQILLTREDLRSKDRHNGIFETMECLLAQGVIPIVNENDTVSADEIKFGDNDTLSAMVASTTLADLLFILSNIPGLIDRQGTGKVVPHIERISPAIEAMAEGTENTTSVGGMISKLSAAKIAQRAGCGVLIGSGQDEFLFSKLLDGQSEGTYFSPNRRPIQSDKRWIAIQDNPKGVLTIKDAAASAVEATDSSLMAAAIIKCRGDFLPGDFVHIELVDGTVMGHGQANCSSAELKEAVTASTAGYLVAIQSEDLVILD